MFSNDGFSKFALFRDETVAIIHLALSHLVITNSDGPALIGSAVTNVTGHSFANAIGENASADTLNGVDAIATSAGMDWFVVHSLGAAMTESAGYGSHAVDAGDFNGDGKADIVWQNSDGTPGVWLMDGLHVIGAGAVGSNPGTDWKVITTGDFNGDGSTFNALADLIGGHGAVGVDMTATNGGNVYHIRTSMADSSTYMVTVSNGTLISENMHVDTLIGNAAANMLDGGAGDDVMVGGAGTHWFFVDNTDSGSNTVYVRMNFHVPTADPGNGAVTETSATDGTGNAFANTTSGHLGADTIAGAAGFGSFFIDNVDRSGIDFADSDTNSVNVGLFQVKLDNLTGPGTVATDGPDNALPNTTSGHDAADIFDGGSGVDTLTGSTGIDWFVINIGGVDNVGGFDWFVTDKVGHGGNPIVGHVAADTLHGGTGADTLAGGAGNDVFIFSPDGGSDLIDGLVIGAKANQVWSTGADPHSFVEALAHPMYYAEPGATVFASNGTYTIIITDVALVQLTAVGFHFG